MSLSTYLALLAFSLVSSITPGPNNIMLFASGVNFGFWRTIPHSLGITFGFAILLAAVGLGLGVVLVQFPTLFLGIKVAGGLYMLYLAWQIANSGAVEVKEGASRPMRFHEAALFQWVNPKAWVMATVATATYTSEGNYALNVAIIVFTFAVINYPVICVWASFGVAMRRFLADPAKLRIFNMTMAFALVASLWPMLSA